MNSRLIAFALIGGICLLLYMGRTASMNHSEPKHSAPVSELKPRVAKDNLYADTPEDLVGQRYRFSTNATSEPEVPITEHGPYEVTHTANADVPGLRILHDGHEIYRYTVRHLAEDPVVMGPYVDLLYGGLADRSDRPQPRPFDDILGNGLPDLVIDEYVLRGGVPESMLTVISLDGTKVVETPAGHFRGEIMFFHDFDGDGSMEIVNTDWEQGFRTFDSNGVPIHKYVWKYDGKVGRYRETGSENPDPPDTRPAGRVKDQ
jgi:hypothetical protein